MNEKRANVALAVVEESLGVHAVDALAAFLVCTGHAIHHCVLRPRVVRATGFGRLRHDFERRHRLRALTQRGAEAIGAGVTASDDDDVLAVGVDRMILEIAFLNLVCNR